MGQLFDVWKGKVTFFDEWELLVFVGDNLRGLFWVFMIDELLLQI
jgi:hypothetical protein